MTATTSDKTLDAQFRHLAVFYETGQDYLDQLGRFVRDGLAARHGTLHIWTEPERLVCEVTDTGHISDPLAGRTRSGRPTV